MQILLKVLTSADPTLSTATVTDAVHAVTSRAGQRRQLAWALQDRPELLTGAGAQAPVPSILRLIDVLIGAGSTRVVRPPCPRCLRVMALSKVLDGVRVCRNCLAKAHAQTCSRCGVHREPATRDEHGRPLCSYCLRPGQPTWKPAWAAPAGAKSAPHYEGTRVPQLPAGQDDDVFDLWALGQMRDLQSHRQPWCTHASSGGHDARAAGTSKRSAVEP